MNDLPGSQKKGPQLQVDDVEFVELLAMEPHGPDTFVALAPRYPWGRLFGGQVVAQALRAAQLTVPPEYAVHSFHSYFIRGGTHLEPVRFEVDRIRNGRSFITRRIVARQSNGAILNMSSSFQKHEVAPDVQVAVAPPNPPDPAGLTDVGWGAMLARRSVASDHGKTISWIRLLHNLPEDDQIAACALAFISDSVPTGAVREAHPIKVESGQHRHDVFVGASLDHTVYFHRPVDPTSWLLADVTCHSLVGARGLTVGNLFDQAGRHVATVVQEVLLRERRAASAGDGGLGGKEV